MNTLLCIIQNSLYKYDMIESSVHKLFDILKELNFWAIASATNI